MFEKNANDNKNSPQTAKELSLKKIFFIIILLIALFFVSGLLIYLKPLFNFNNEVEISEKKTEILKLVDLYATEKIPLKEKEKEEIFETLSESKIQEYNFSKEEKIKLLKALNSK